MTRLTNFAHQTGACWYCCGDAGCCPAALQQLISTNGACLKMVFHLVTCHVKPKNVWLKMVDHHTFPDENDHFRGISHGVLAWFSITPKSSWSEPWDIVLGPWLRRTRPEVSQVVFGGVYENLWNIHKNHGIFIGDPYPQIHSNIFQLYMMDDDRWWWIAPEGAAQKNSLASENALGPSDQQYVQVYVSRHPPRTVGVCRGVEAIFRVLPLDQSRLETKNR